MGASSPLALELILDVDVSEVEIDRRRLEAVVAQDLLRRRQADPLLQARRGERVSHAMRAHVFGEPRAVGHRLDDVLSTPRLDRERLLQREVVLQECPHAVGRRHHADLGLLAVLAALDLDPELALLPEDVLRGEAAQLADAEPSVEQGPDDEPLDGCLAGDQTRRP